jgi:hypothetical protein
MNQNSHARRVIVKRTWDLSLAFVAVLGMLGDWQFACAQSSIVAVGPPSFQSTAVPSLEGEMLYRMSYLGQYEPGDLNALARLAELRSISTIAGVQDDLRGSVAGAQLERETRALWNATGSFDQALTNWPADAQNLAASESLLTNTQAAFDRLNSSLGGLPALSPRGASYLEGISRILPFQESALQMNEPKIARPAGVSVARRVNLAELRAHATLLARALAELTQEIKQLQGNPSNRATALTELSRLLELISGFDRMLGFEPDLPEITESFCLLIRGAWSAKSAVIKIASGEAWRPLHDRLRAISGMVQVPRAQAASSRAPVGPVTRRTSDLLAVIDRADSLIAAAVGAEQTPDGNEPPTSELGDRARRLEVRLLVWRQHVLTGDSVAELEGGLLEIEALSQQLLSTPQPTPALAQGGGRERICNFERVGRTIKRLRGLLTR